MSRFRPRWEVVLKKEQGDIIIDYFNNRKEAEEEIEYRNTLCRHMGYTPDVTYIVRKSISRNKK
tara:strand:+ start:320 stop:511 length:192 start_codon:yes stop_codon:yes gene_type:complete